MGEILTDLKYCAEPFQTAVRSFLEVCKSYGIDVFVTESGRTKERQQDLYDQGRTKPGEIVTWTLNSKHLIPSNAVDIAFRGDELYPIDINKWLNVFDIADACHINSLYLMYGVDKPHLEWYGTIPYVKKELDNYKLTVNFMSKYVEIMEKEVPKDQRLFKEIEGEEVLKEKDVKALIEIAMFRARS